MPDRLMMEDAALAEEARNGNSAAFVKLANRWWTPLYRVSWIVSGSASCAAQITERTLLAAIHSAEPPLFTRVPFKVFLYRVAVRLTLTREPRASTGRQPQDALGTIREALQRLDGGSRCDPERFLRRGPNPHSPRHSVPHPLRGGDRRVRRDTGCTMSSRRAVTVPDRSGRASGIVVEARLQTVSKTEAHLRVVPRTGEEIEPAVNALF